MHDVKTWSRARPAHGTVQTDAVICIDGVNGGLQLLKVKWAQLQNSCEWVSAASSRSATVKMYAAW